MATFVGEALLAASLEVLLKKIVSGDFVDLFRNTKLDVELLEKLKITLLSHQSVLHDAGEKQVTNPAVKEWLNMLLDAVFEVDDLFDEINTEALRCKMEADQVLKKLSSRFKRFNKDINSKLQKLFERLEQLIKQNLGLKEGVSSGVWNAIPTSSVVGDESAIYGRDGVKEKLKKLLLSENGSDGGSKIGVISIVGMGGIGKTTLAKLLYNDHEVKERFELRGWSHVSKDLDVVAVTKSLLESVTSETITTNDLNKLQVHLQQSLSNKKFLLVLDDIWYGRYVGWNSLNDIFNAGGMGSKIIITTRDERVALPLQNFLSVHHLRSLETEDSWSLLARHAFVERNYQEHPNLENIGRGIAKKCGGLPLAAVTLGGILRTKLSQDYWSDVLKSSIWELTNDEVQPALLLSYRHLPAPLKGCFAYCSIFPKNSVLLKRRVVQLWIAEGLIPHPKSDKSWEKVAEEYFDELVSRSLIRQRAINDEEVDFEMHDLINDLAMTVSFPYCIRLDEHKPDKKVRHLSYTKGENDSSDKFDKLHGLKSLRTFLPLPLQELVQPYSISEKLVFYLLSTMKHLHVLSLSQYQNITEFPSSIGSLIYLRYLDLSRTWIKRLPSETCKLYNLQTLLLSGCLGLTKLPKEMGKLVNLRHLDIRRTPLKKLPIQLSRLENLQTLSDFIVSIQDDGLNIGDLGKYPHLRGNLSISQLQNVSDTSHAFQAKLEMKKEIDQLNLKWSDVVPSNSQIQSVVLEWLRPSTNLKSLTITGYGGDKLPNWLGDSLFVNMVRLSIWSCNNCSEMPSLGKLGNLKELSIGIILEWEEWRPIGGTSPEFPSLTCLSVKHCPKLKGNIPGNLPKLTSLTLINCPKLKGMTPNNLPSLSELWLEKCPLMMESWHSNDINNIIITSPSLDIFSQLMISLNSLRIMELNNIPSLKSFPREGLPKTLQRLTIRDCENLEFLPSESMQNYTSLEHLGIHNSCNSMASFNLCSLPVLKSLSIYFCKNIKSILITEDMSQHNLLFLRVIRIGYCNELESVSLSGLPIPNLTHLIVHYCKKLHSLPEPLNILANLQVMEIDNLPNLQLFSVDDLPISLRELRVHNIGGILWNTTLESHNYFSVLRIKGDDIVKALMEMEFKFLPASLVTLEISHLEDIECLDEKWLQHLTYLHKLKISHAPKLKSLPEEGKFPSSLKKLHIFNCPLLEPSTGFEIDLK